MNRESDLPRLRIGSVSFLNARPLIHGLEEQPDLSLELDVPARLLEGLSGNRFDVALLPVIDYQRMPGLRIIPAGAIGSEAATLTVRIFSRVPIGQIGRLACDTDSHTSVALARVVLAHLCDIRPEFVELSPASAQDVEAQLLIGDKVVCDEPAGFDHQLDLGEAWKNLTGLPFVFAAWMARPGVDLRDLPQRLAQAREEGLRSIETILKRHAAPRGWPIDLARQYLTQNLHYSIGPKQLEAIGRFHALAAEENLIVRPPRPLEVIKM